MIIQVGHTDYEPENAEWFRFIDPEKINEIYNNADIIVAHAGAGTLLDAIYFEKDIVVVPRIKKYNEHIDDQQLELAKTLEKSGKALAVYDIKDLDHIIKKTAKMEKTIFNNDKDLTNYLKEFLGD